MGGVKEQQNCSLEFPIHDEHDLYFYMLIGFIFKNKLNVHCANYMQNILTGLISTRKGIIETDGVNDQQNNPLVFPIHGFNEFFNNMSIDFKHLTQYITSF